MAMEYKPRLIFWELTTGCNLHCIHCRASATELSSPDDLDTATAKGLIDQFAEYAPLILVLSGGEPLYRRDVLELARYARQKGLKVALATNGTLVTAALARRIVDAGIVRVAMSLDGADAGTHDSFRGMPGSFEAMMTGFRHLKELGMSLQFNTTIARHNMHQLPAIYEMALRVGADALHTFLLVPVGCGVEIAAQQMVPPEQYEQLLHWFYDREKEGRIELKATCAPHYFRVRKQRQVEERSKVQGEAQVSGLRSQVCKESQASGLRSEVCKESQVSGPRSQVPHGMPSRHPELAAVTRGCLAGSGVCFVSHKGEVYPCGYLPAKAGDLLTQSFREVWEQSTVFQLLRDTANLKGKCGICEFRNICEGCRARAYAATGDYLDEEPVCVYVPRSAK
jgi:radical SAM protein with 4Fe4S-binding SPASM domain